MFPKPGVGLVSKQPGAGILNNHWGSSNFSSFMVHGRMHADCSGSSTY